MGTRSRPGLHTPHRPRGCWPGPWQGGAGWAGWSPQSHETQLLPTWLGGPYLQDPRRQRSLPALSFMAPQRPIGCWPEGTPPSIATSPLPVTSAQDAFLFGSKTHTPPWLPGLHPPSHPGPGLPLPTHVPGGAQNTARSGAPPGVGGQAVNRQRDPCGMWRGRGCQITSRGVGSLRREKKDQD